MTDPRFGPLPDHGRFPYRPITRRAGWRWPGGAGLAVYLGFNLEHFAFGEGLGAALGPVSPAPDVLNFSWREYGNRVGAWRCLEAFDRLGLPCAAIVNTALADHAPELVQACVARGDELVAHGHTNAERQGGWPEEDERALLRHCRERLAALSGRGGDQGGDQGGVQGGPPPAGWLSPWISESPRTPDLLAETGYRYTLNWCHDDQPTRMATRGGQGLWAIPYPQELNDIPMIVARQMEAPDFARLIIDQCDEMLAQSATQPLVMGVALHAYLVGQPHRLRHLRVALEHLAAARDAGRLWFTTPGAICDHVDGLAAANPHWPW